MRELRSCDFCGADAVGTFAIVPPELEPTEAEQRRVVCCGDCKNRLEGLLEPLLARAGLEGAGAGETDASGHRGVEADETGDGGTVVASSDESTQKRQRTSSPNATVSDADGEIDPGANDPETDPETDYPETEPDTDNPETGSGLADGITFERAGTDAGDDSSEGDSSDEPDTSTTQTASGASETSDADGTAGQSPSQPPKSYAKVLRLLQNREFPMQRSAVSNLAAGAYDLETHEVDAIIDHALESGEFTEERGKLHRA